jgi:nitrogen regulatory protein PII
MAFLVVFVIDNPDQCGGVLDAWDKAGARGVTILESTGINRLRNTGIIDNLPLMPSLRDVLRGKETHHRTIFSVVTSEEEVDALVDASQRVVGDLDLANTGLIFVVPVLRVIGLMKAEGESG